MSDIRGGIQVLVREALEYCVLDWLGEKGLPLGDILAAYQEKRSHHFEIPDAEIEEVVEQMLRDGLLKRVRDRYDLTPDGQTELQKLKARGKVVKEKDESVKERAVEQLLACQGQMDGKRAVDVGTGDGFLAFRLAEAGCVVVGVDIKAEQIEKAKAKAEAEGIAHVSFETGGVLSARPFSPFDVAVSRYVFHHLEDQAGTLKGMYEVLKPGGKLACIDFRVGLACFFLHGFITFCALTEAEWEEALVQCGFDEINVHLVDSLLVVEAVKPETS